MSLNSLKEAVLAVVEEMTQEANDLKSGDDAAHDYLHDTLKGYARTLRLVVKAAGEEAAPAPAAPLPVPGLFSSPLAQHEREIDRFRDEFRRRQSVIALEENHSGGDMVAVVGGPAAPDDTPVYQSINSSMPEGGYTELAGAIYQLQRSDDKRRLVFDAVQTERLRQQRGKQ